MLIVQYYRRGEQKDLFGVFQAVLHCYILSSCLLVHFVSKHTHTHTHTTRNTATHSISPLDKGKIGLVNKVTHGMSLPPSLWLPKAFFTVQCVSSSAHVIQAVLRTDFVALQLLCTPLVRGPSPASPQRLDSLCNCHSASFFILRRTSFLSTLLRRAHAHTERWGHIGICKPFISRNIWISTKITNRKEQQPNERICLQVQHETTLRLSLFSQAGPENKQTGCIDTCYYYTIWV